MFELSFNTKFLGKMKYNCFKQDEVLPLLYKFLVETGDSCAITCTPCVVEHRLFLVTRQSNGNFDLKFRDPVFEVAVSLFKDISKKKEQ